MPSNQYMTPVCRSLLVTAVRHGGTFCIHPYKWNQPSQQFQRTTDKNRLAMWYVNTVIPIAYFIFVTFRAVQTMRDETASPRDVILGGFGVAFYLFPATFQLTFFLCGDEIPGLINHGLKLLQELNSAVPPIKHRPNQKYPFEVRVAELFACGIFYGFQLLGVMMVAFGFIFPGTKFLASSLHEDPRDLSNPYRLLSFLFMLYITQSYVFSGWSMAITVVTLVFPLSPALQALSYRPLSMESLHHYRCFQLWVAKFNRVIGPLLYPIGEIILMVLSTLGIVGVIRYPGVVGLVVGNVGVTAYLILYFIFRFSATVHTSSEEVIERWKFHARGPFARQLRTLRPVSMSVGSYFFVDMGLILTATAMIVDNSITLLLLE